MQETDELLLETFLLAGKIMMENGSEVYRVEDTMNRIAANAGEANSNQLCDRYRHLYGITKQSLRSS